MAVEDIAVSGPEAGDAGESKGGLAAAIEKASAAIDTGENDVPVTEALKAKNGKGKAAAVAADTSDKADEQPDLFPDPKAKAKATETAAPDGNAALEAPKHWPEDRRKQFAGLPADAQKAVLTLSKELEGGFTRKSMEVSDKVKFADAIGGLFADDTTRHQLSQSGLDEVGYVRYLHQLQRFATSDPVRYLGWAMQNLGVSPEHLGFGARGVAQGQQPQQQPSSGDPALDDLLVDPALKALRQDFGRTHETIQQLQARLDAQDRAAQQRQAQQQHYAQQQLMGMWSEFRSSLDDSGQLAHPHADDLRVQMGAIMETDPEIAPMRDGPDKLKAAYEAAIWARPALRNTRLEAEKAKAAADAEKRREAERAKAASGPKRALGAPAVPAKKGGIAGALDAAWASVGRE